MRYRVLIVVLLMLSSIQFAEANTTDLVNKGRALQKAGKYEQALKLYKQSIKSKPSVQLYIEAGTLLGKMHKYKSAAAVLDLALKDFPDNTSLMNMLALIKMREGDKNTARELWNKVIEFNPNNTFAKKWLRKSGNENKKTNSNTTVANAEEDSKDENSNSSPSAEGVYKPSHALSKADQQKLAIDHYKQMMALDKWEIDEIIRLHKEVIEKCPDTDKAQESCWRLSNLYLLAEDPANFEEIINVLEYLLKEYPNTPLMPDAKNRLLLSYQKNGQNDKVVELYEELFSKDPDPIDEKVFMVRSLEFANALEAVGNSAEAERWYQKIIAKDNGRDTLEARVAKDRLENPK